VRWGTSERIYSTTRAERVMSKKPITYWSIEESNITVARKLEAAAKCRPGPQRQKALREAKRYKSLLEAKKSMLGIMEASDKPLNRAR
jgi:hypothetical protein